VKVMQAAVDRLVLARGRVRTDGAPVLGICPRLMTE
jgi:hypothetical protein